MVLSARFSGMKQHKDLRSDAASFASYGGFLIMWGMVVVAFAERSTGF